MKKRKITIYQLCVIAMMTALLCVLAPMSVPIGPVPITLATMVIYFMVYVLGPWMGTCSVCLYIFLGAIGLPVFSGFAGGLGKLAGPTGGYIAGYILMAFVGGIIIKKAKYNMWAAMLSWVIGTAVLYTFGTAWFMYLTSSALPHAMALCVFPFIPGDIVKIIAGTFIGKTVRTALLKTNVMKQISA